MLTIPFFLLGCCALLHQTDHQPMSEELTVQLYITQNVNMILFESVLCPVYGGVYCSMSAPDAQLAVALARCRQMDMGFVGLWAWVQGAALGVNIFIYLQMCHSLIPADQGLNGLKGKIIYKLPCFWMVLMFCNI